MSYSASVRNASAVVVDLDAPITTVIFGVDSTLYPASLGIDRLRREQVLNFMIDVLGFSRRWAEPVLLEFVAKYKNELKALQMAEVQGYFPEGVEWLSDSGLSWLAGAFFAAQTTEALLAVPPHRPPAPPLLYPAPPAPKDRSHPSTSPTYPLPTYPPHPPLSSLTGSDPYSELSQYLEEHTDLSSLSPVSERLRAFLGDCMQRDTYRGVEGAFKLIAFSGAPRGFIFNVLERLQLTPYFDDIGKHDYLTARRIFGAENVLPFYKPQVNAFKTVLTKSMSDPLESVIVDSNLETLRAAKALGIRTVRILDPYLVEHGFHSAEEVEAGVDVAVVGLDGVIDALAQLGGASGAGNTQSRRMEEALEHPDVDRVQNRNPLEHRCPLGGRGSMRGDATDGVSSTVWEEWEHEWDRRLERWWLALPAGSALERCVPFLGGVLLSRFQEWMAAIGRALRSPPPDGLSPPQNDRLGDECEALLNREGTVQSPELPDFPEPPLELRWGTPAAQPLTPLPRLVPRRLVLLGDSSRSELHRSRGSSEGGSWASSGGGSWGSSGGSDGGSDGGRGSGGRAHRIISTHEAMAVGALVGACFFLTIQRAVWWRRQRARATQRL